MRDLTPVKLVSLFEKHPVGTADRLAEATRLLGLVGQTLGLYERRQVWADIAKWNESAANREGQPK